MWSDFDIEKYFTIKEKKFIKKEDFTKESLLEFDPLTLDMLKLFVEKQFASISMPIRIFHIDKDRTTKIVDKLEQIGFISKADGSKAREVYITLKEYNEMFTDYKFLKF